MAKAGEVFFSISKYDDLKKMLNRLKSDFETQHIASELGHNMLEEGNEGKIVIDTECVTNQIRFKDKKDLCLKKERLQEGLNAAQSICLNGSEKRTASYGKSFPENRGRGLSSILMMGWDIKIQEIGEQYIQIVVKKKHQQKEETLQSA